MASRRRTIVAGVTGALCLARPATVRRRSGDDDTAAVIRHLGHTELVGLIEEGVRILDFAESDLRERAERADTGDADVESALVASRDLAFHGEVVLVHLAKLVEGGFPFEQLAGDSDLRGGANDGAFHRVPHIEPVKLGCSHHSFGRSAVGDERIFAGNGDDLPFEQFALCRSLEIQARFERLSETVRLSVVSGLRHGV